MTVISERQNGLIWISQARAAGAQARLRIEEHDRPHLNRLPVRRILRIRVVLEGGVEAEGAARRRRPANTETKFELAQKATGEQERRGAYCPWCSAKSSPPLSQHFISSASSFTIFGKYNHLCDSECRVR